MQTKTNACRRFVFTPSQILVLVYISLSVSVKQCSDLLLHSSCVSLHLCLSSSFSSLPFLSSACLFSLLPVLLLSPPLSLLTVISLYISLALLYALLLLLRLLFFPFSLSSGCVKFSWGLERLAFKPGGRRTRFLSTPCLALCV